MPTVSLSPSLAPEMAALLRDLGRRAAEAGATLWLVGGPVRDALLGAPVLDVDLVAEMPAAELAQAMGVPAYASTRFGTLKLHVDGSVLDLATARAERYARPGALPTVRPSDIETDLRRRDFTLNAMAVNLSPTSFGTLLDPLEGQRDLKRRVLRGLHSGTFRDDATRMLRLMRYAARLRFRIHPVTARWLREGLPALPAISAARIHRELRRTLDEPRAAHALRLAQRYGVLSAVHPAMGTDAVAAALHTTARRGGRAEALLVALTVGGDADGVADRIGLTRRERTLIAHANRLLSDASLSRPGLPPSEVAAIVGNAPIVAAQAAASLLTGSARRNLLRYLAATPRRAHLTGRDMLRLGVPQGPSVGRALAVLRNARLDRRVATRTGEVRLVGRLLREGGLA